VSPVSRPTDIRFFASAAELRDWFDANAETADGLWLGHHRTSTGVPGPSVMEAIEEGLCVGWVDSTVYRIDASTYARRFTPRRPGSIWSARNVAIAERLIAEGRMRPAGLAAFEARTPDRTAIYSYERAAAAFTDAETARFRANDAAWADWERRPPSYRRTVTFWVASAKRPETRARRLDALIADSAAGQLVAPFRALRRGRSRGNPET
jgi:uncharacterized protein YdeI (YjbR/CyaY-like superfamily)